MNPRVLQSRIKKSYNFIPGKFPLSSSRIGDIVNESAEKYGDSVAVISTFQNLSKTYSEFRHEVEKLASGLISIGLRKGDRIAIYSPNCYEWLLTQYATAKAGLILVNINPSFQSIELEHCLKKVGCKTLISTKSLLSTNFYETFCGINANLPKDANGKLHCSRLPELESIVMISERNTSGILNFKNVFVNGNEESDKILCEIENSILFDDPVNIQFTSGTTGAAKGVVLTHFNVVNNALSAGRRYGFDIQTPITCSRQLFHTVGYVLCSLATICFGGTIVMPSPAFDTVSCLKAIEKHECSVVYGTPTTFVDMIRNYQSGNFNTTSLKQIIITGATCSSKILKDIKGVFGSPRIAIGYGSTETSPSIANTSIENFENLDGYMKPCDYVEVKIINSEGHLVPKNTQGEICTRGFNTFQGYWDEEKKTAEVLDKARWYHTGDLGLMNDEGCIKIVGRIKDIIIRGGENIYPADIESFLSYHPSVAEVHICGVPDERLVEEACAWICLRDGKHLTEKEVKEFFKGKISDDKIPRYVMFVKDFPKTASGKIKKFEMTKISIEKLKL